MITISQNQLDQVEYLLHQSIQGNHVLFDPDALRRTFCSASGSPLSPQGQLIEKLLSEPTLERKRAFLEKLDPASFDALVRTYFSIVESKLHEKEKVYH